MSGDYTRMRYSARSGYIGVLEQQGRVRLDADGNELVESLDRRRRAECIDTIGHGVVPVTTNDAFLIKQVGGKYTIGAGRAYVDGILVDCWGDDASQAFQADLGEMRSPNPLAFENQPFHYTNAFPAPPANAPSIVYLDVWEREVTALEDPGLIEPAIEGIDTTTRIQAAWQVKALGVQAAPASCADTPPEWQALIAPSTGVLSTATTPAPASGSPCTIDPVGGYTGLENRLYRVQIHQSGTVDGAGAAQFVWSQDNASLGAALLAITKVSPTTCQLTVSTVGRDKTLAFNVNDAIEVLDDFVEWSIRETNRGGTFVTVQQVDPEQLTLTVTPDISASFAVVPARNPRIRKWGAAPQPTQNGVAIALGTDGVTATFGPNAAATLRAGDFWAFFARTATGTIEILSQAPPRGVLHHYMKLALVNPPQTIQNCPPHWPPTFGEGCCTVVVAVGDDIQTAIDSLPQAGGCICLKTGVHDILKPIEISGRSSISLHGESIGAVVQNAAGGQALIIGNAAASTTDITVEGLAFAVVGQKGTQLITMTNAARCAVRDCHLGTGPAGPGPSLGIGFVITGGAQIEIRKNQVTGVITGIEATGVQGLIVAENGITGITFTNPGTGALVSSGVVGIDIIGPTGGIVNVEGNEIVDFSQGVLAQAGAPTALVQPLQVSIIRNLVIRHGADTELVSNFGWSAGPGTIGALVLQKFFGIFTDISDAQVAGNTLDLADPHYGGILIAGSGIAVSGNSISSSVVAQPPYRWPVLPVGIVAYKPMLTAQVDRCRIAENVLVGQLKGIAVVAEIDDLIAFPAIAGNRVTNGVTALADEAIDLTEPLKTIDTLTASLISLGHAFGILLINADRAAVTRNVVSTCTVGISALLWQVSLRRRGPRTAGGVTLDGNDVDSSTIGILSEVHDSVIRDGEMLDNHAAIVLHNASGALVVGNRCRNLAAVVHGLDLAGDGNRFEDNLLSGGATGLLATAGVDVWFGRNVVDSTNGTGIVALACDGQIGIEGNRALFCGATGQSAIEAHLVGTVEGWPFGKSLAAGIAAVNCSGLITIDGCAVTETAQPAGGSCADIAVLGGAHVRVRNCRVVRHNDAVIKSRAMILLPAGDEHDRMRATADVSDNHVDVTNNSGNDSDFVAAEITCRGDRSDIILVGNMILQRVGSDKNILAVRLTAESQAITGNRILREFQNDQPSLFIAYTAGLSYVGNVVTFGAQINPSASTPFKHPTPPEDFNADVHL
jgi:hypothetical protein